MTESCGPDQGPRTRLFVYGTLKKGTSNHFRLLGQPFLTFARTVPRYRLYRIGWFPGLVEDPEGGYSVEGEIYAVDAATLRQLDEFEGVPALFRRQTVQIEGTDHPTEAYFFVGETAGCPEVGSCWTG